MDVPVPSFDDPTRSRPGAAVALCALALWLLALPAAAQAPVSNLVFTVGTTIQDSGGHHWSYVLIGAPRAQLLAGKRFSVFGKPGFPTNAVPYTLRGTIFQQNDPGAISALLSQSTALGGNLTSLSNSLNVLLRNVPGASGLPLAQKVAAAFQAAASDANTAQLLELLAHVHPGLTLCAGRAFAEQIAAVTTYEVREVDPATSSPGDVLGRVTITPGAPVILPAPGYPFQVLTSDPSDDLRIRLRWGTPPELRRLSLLSFGFNVWRIPLADALTAGYHTNPPSLSQLYANARFVPANQAPVMAGKDFSTGHGAGAADDPADLVTYFLTDDNGRARGLTPFEDGAQFYYFVTARDVLGRDGLVSPGGLAQACRRAPPQPPGGLAVQNTSRVLTLGGNKTNVSNLLLAWQQNTNAADRVSEYWVYRWPNPSMVWTNDSAPLSNRVGVVAQTPGADANSFLDDGPTAPRVPGLTNFWYTVRAVSQGACGPLLSPHTPPAWGVLRERSGPAGATGTVVGSCGAPVVAFLQSNTLTNSGPPDVFHLTYRFTCQRRDPGIAWAMFLTTNQIGKLDVVGPLYFPPNGDAIQADYSVTLAGSNALAAVACAVGTYYGVVSEPEYAYFAASPLPNQRLESVFFAGQLLLTSMRSDDPLRARAVNPNSCFPGNFVTAYPDGAVSMSFDVRPSGPMLVQVSTNRNPVGGPLWADLGVAMPDTNNLYWIHFPDCPLNPLPPFRGCQIRLPGGVDCSQHVTRAADGGAVAPIQIRFQLTPRTREYRLYRSINDGPLSLLSQGAAAYQAGRTMVRTDDAMPPSAARLCYFVQLLDEHGNSSPMVLLGCKEVKPAKLPRPVLAEPQAQGNAGAPQVMLNWFCPTAGVYRFEIKIERADQPGGGQPTGFSSSKLVRSVAFNSYARFYGLIEGGTAPAHFDEAHLTPPVGNAFGPGPQFTLAANVLSGVPYQISVAAMDNQGHSGNPSQVWKFIWQPTNPVPTVPWPARPLPPAKGFDEDLFATTNGAFLPRVSAVLLRNPNLQLDFRYPVGIRIGEFGPIPASPETIGTTNLITYVVPSVGSRITFIAPPADPHTLVFTRKSQDPTRKGELLLPIVVYRQQVANTNFPQVSGALTQVTPLLERIPYSTVACPTCEPDGTFVTIYDRLLGAGLEVDRERNGAEYFLYLRDQQPVIIGAAYQYFVVRLNAQHEISEVIPAGTVTIPSN